MSPKREPVRVVVADDAVDLRNLLKLALSIDGDITVVGEATNGVEAVEVAKDLEPDVIVLDVSMPLMDGLQAAAAIKKRRAETRIVMYSGFRATELKSKSLDAGADAYLEKDGDLTALKSLILSWRKVETSPTKRKKRQPALIDE